MKPSAILVRAGSATALAALLLLVGCGKNDKPAAAAPPPQVGVHQVQVQRHVFSTELPGRTSARQTAEIRPQVGGILLRRLFEEGAAVKAGQPLYQIDPASYQAAVASAQATLAKAEASLNSARVTAQRNGELAKLGALSQQLSDDSQAALQQAEAELAVARAALQSARINLERTRITAPIAGRVELSSVTPGSLLTANQAEALTTVQQLDPLYVDIVQSSSELLRLKRELADGSQQAAGKAGEAPIRLLLEDGSAYPHAGRLQFSGVTVNRSTGAVTLRALVPNPEGLLMPGMYVRALVQTGVKEQAILVPQQGIARAPNGEASALVVGADNKVERRAVTVDRAVGNRWQVTTGLKAGERIIIDGPQRAKVGAAVRPLTVDPAEPGASAPAAASAPASASRS
ncbi:efflux RND transporter periplasmic adaptor subunit [Paucibacter sp. XJ19-41]|uniref:efflux RND transporter periplasmic adaptor subunit n=1 Tax=Paucibacter sp. XJ19-41 TaxID=2927824 RepID=UPI00234BFC1F|nr:efflux RND transporter periplasmic adaptor subunit [Paucibacter sp. XJ19-41]MDC6166942.1 efflux RND transporter periplasmic adaptor subunit [Paucibacter sp. XJ19-41]